MFKKILKNAFLISFFSVISISSTIFINKITKIKIASQKEEERKFLLEQVLSPTVLNQFEIKLYQIKNKSLGNDKNHNLWLLLNKKKEARAAVIETTAPDGYSGSINMLVAAYLNGKIIGVRVLDHQETPGIGDKIELAISDWITKFSNMYISSPEDKDFLLKKYGGKIEQFTGATITPQAVTNSVKRTVIFIKNIPSILKFLNKDVYEN
ncbi:MAG: electron transport complex subunit RsxG [Buchnera aphidicola (Brevicoryne brassicae)]|uniref:Ion-translocating oxidoreductase complex subunit G n=1 Tax=Buchnera aphidicola (Brevicoryne brassicae) TaxID=911343 RepID=A0AAJ5PUR8_9GAMM|nr:electron transport complex subunit RsxG [Buchnera aphidicola]QCI19698.1 electron transport complex subunit RsxG [Buchnera aphidicola (Brevicoryne brassicae)]WAI19066.1 MAG: electron transport complex subunit RsxG [Buchnera aphidicola (Brevicoryne brassicae)]